MSAGVHADLQELINLRATAHSLRFSGQIRSHAVRAGAHLSAHRGRGLEFDEVRIYQAGDDVRSIDWRVTARRGRPHTKLFCEEREQPVMLLVDLGPTMFFGSRRQFKSVMAARAAALSAWTALQDGNRVGGVVTGNNGARVLPPRARKTGVLPLLHAIERGQPQGPGAVTAAQGGLDEALRKLVHTTPPASMIVLLSDFRDLGVTGEKQWHLLSRHNEILVGFIFDPFEQAPPQSGFLRLGTRERLLDIDPRSRNHAEYWRRGFNRHRQRVQDLCAQTGTAMVELSTAEEADQVLRRAFRRFGRKG
jgi:uncharacterized protein (DUF58 family)